MKLMAQVRLLPDAAQAGALRATLDLANQTANAVSEDAWQRGVFRCFDLHHLVYRQVHEDLRGIRDRVRLRRPQRATLHSWAIHQFGRFVSYKARLSIAGRAASLGMPTGTQLATSPGVVWRAGLPPTSRTWTGRALPELQAEPFAA